MNFQRFLFYIPQPLLTETRTIAGENSISASAFIRQSIIRNIRAYRATESAMNEAKARSAQVRY
jgi:hypothetical protein